MADAGFFKGTSAEQDRRFSDKETKLLKSMKFPPEFDKKVDMRKVNLTVIRPWIAKKIVELVGFEDEVVIEYAMGLLEDHSQPMPDPRKMQINLTGFLTKDTPAFMSALWKLLLEAQEDVTGVPRTMVEEKKEEMRKARENDTRAIDERDRRARLDEMRDPERGQGGGPGRGRGRGRGRGGRGGYDEDRRQRDSGWGGRGGRPGGGPPRRRESRSPLPPRRRSPSMASSRASRSPPGRRYRSPMRRRSPSRSISRSRTPPRRRSPPVRRRSLSRRSVSSSRSRSRTPVSRRRPFRSPSYTPSPRDRNRRYKGRRSSRSRSPPPRRRRLSPRRRSPSESSSRSRPSPRAYGRRRSVTPPRRRRSLSPRGRKASFSRSPSPNQARGRGRSAERRGADRIYGSSRSRSRSMDGDKHRMDIEEELTRKGPVGELKIKGQAELARKRGEWRDMEVDDVPGETQAELEKRENELKEKALRNKVMRTRKGT